MQGTGSDPVWASWPPQRAARPELLPHIPVAAPADFSSAWADLDPAEMSRIIPLYLQRVAAAPRRDVPAHQ